MARRTAVDVNNDFDLQEEKDVIKPNHKAGYEKYVNYMKRTGATQSEEIDKLPTFDENTNNLDKEQENLLKEKLLNAQANGNLMWEGVLSFRTDFLKEQLIYEPKNGRVNQKAIKIALRQAMPYFLKSNGFGSNAFWWADIHLNTNHLHVHFSISETGKSKRPVHRDDELKGMLKEKTFKRLRNKVYQNLEQPGKRNLEIEAQKSIEIFQKKEMDLFKGKEKKELIQNQILLEAYRRLPLNQKITSFKSNRRDFQTSKKLLMRYIDDKLNDNVDFHKYLHLLAQEEKKYRTIYGYDNSSYSQNHLKDFQNKIGNTLLKQLNDLQVGDLQSTEVSESVASNSEQNALSLDILKHRLSMTSDDKEIKKIKRQMSLKRIAIRQENLEKRLMILNDEKKALAVLKINDPLVDFLNEMNVQKSLLTKLELKPRFKLNTSEKSRRAQLKQKFLNPIELSVTSRLLDNITEYQNLNIQEQKLIENSKLSEDFFLKFYKRNRGNQIMYLKEQLRILNIKQNINVNNKILRNSNDRDLKLQYENVRLFKKIGTELEMVRKDILPIRKESDDERTARNTTTHMSKPEYRSMQPKPKILSEISKFTSANISSSAVQSLREQEKMDRNAEREEKIEEQQR